MKMLRMRTGRRLQPHSPLAPVSPLQNGGISSRLVQLPNHCQPSSSKASSSTPSRRVVVDGLAREILARSEVEGDPIAFLDVSEAFWKALRNQKHEPEKKGPTVVKKAEGRLGSTDYDVAICGGTLGLFLATSLQQRGFRVVIIEKRLVQGRNQEWNISRGELQVLLDLDLLTPEELESTIISEFNPIRVGFKGGKDVWVNDCLNLGVQPRLLLDILKTKFRAAGGIIYENTTFRSASVYEDGLQLTLRPGGKKAAVSVGDTNRPNGIGESVASGPVAPNLLNTRLLLDCMGHYSEIVKQIRGKVKPDGMCMVVGSCAEGFDPQHNQSADLLYSLTDASADMQMFWEAFPAEGGKARTTYMFAYSDAHPSRPTFEQLLDTYFELMPEYQSVDINQLRFKRVLFGGFPTYSDGPLAPAFDRVMQIGDASCAQSPLSFGGFGSMMRHLSRFTRGVSEALQADRLTRFDLGWIQPYQPSLSASWLFQRSMSVGVGQVKYPQDYVATHTMKNAAELEPVLARAEAAAVTAQASAGLRYQAMTVGGGAQLGASVGALAYAAATAVAEPWVASHGGARDGQFSAGAAMPDDYFNVFSDEEAPPSLNVTSQSLVGKGSTSNALVTSTFEKDFSEAPDWARLPHDHVNAILGTNFSVMSILGDRILRPFLQDTIQLIPLSLSMTGMLLANPVVISRVFLQVGPKTLVWWFLHYFALVAYSLGHVLLSPLRPVVKAFYFQRLLDALEYGSGFDYDYHAPKEPVRQITDSKQE